MPWATPTLRKVREMVRDDITAALSGAVMVGNNVLRVMSDAMAGLAHLTLRYIGWVALQLMPDTAEREWLDRHGDIWLTNADGTTGRKMPTYAIGKVAFTGTIPGTVVPTGTRLSNVAIAYELLEDITIGTGDSPGQVRALDPGVGGNMLIGETISMDAAITGVDLVTTVVEDITGGVDIENDDDLRTRVLERIRQPPMGGDLTDYIAWAKAVPGVTRAWCYPLEMGIGTVTVRFMMDALRADNDGFPVGFDAETVKAYIDTVRPVAVKDFFIVAPIPRRVDVYINDLVPDTETLRAAIEASLDDMLMKLAKPGQTIFAAWKYYAIMNTPGVESFDMLFSTDDVMPSPGHMPILGDIVYGGTV